MKKCKGILFENEAKRVLARNWEDFSWAHCSTFSKAKTCEAIRRAMVRAYRRGLRDTVR